MSNQAWIRTSDYEGPEDDCVDLSITSQDLRKIIQGKISMRKCPDCQGEGVIYLQFENDDYDYENPKQISAQQFAELADPLEDGHAEICENCNGVGYVKAFDE